MAEILSLCMLSLACGAASMTIAKSSIFEGLRVWVSRRWPMAGKGISCPYCTSHWVAFALTAVYFRQVRFISCGIAILDFFTAAMAMAALAAIPARVIFSAYSAMGQKDKE
jgi:hypothetical protein